MATLSDALSVEIVPTLALQLNIMGEILLIGLQSDSTSANGLAHNG
jgi:hypothetical protein